MDSGKRSHQFKIVIIKDTPSVPANETPSAPATETLGAPINENLISFNNLPLAVSQKSSQDAARAPAGVPDESVDLKYSSGFSSSDNSKLNGGNQRADHVYSLKKVAEPKVSKEEAQPGANSAAKISFAVASPEQTSETSLVSARISDQPRPSDEQKVKRVIYKLDQSNRAPIPVIVDPPRKNPNDAFFKSIPFTGDPQEKGSLSPPADTRPLLVPEEKPGVGKNPPPKTKEAIQVPHKFYKSKKPPVVAQDVTPLDADIDRQELTHIYRPDFTMEQMRVEVAVASRQTN